jgi:hypothetical protein
MVWIGRYVKKYNPSAVRLKGGKWMLSLLMVFVLIELAFQVINQLNK